MKNINLINTPSPEKQLAVYRWYQISAYSFAILCIILGAINGYQYYQLAGRHALKKQMRQVSEDTNLTTQRLQELSTLDAKLNAQRTKMNAPKSFKPSAYLRALSATIPDDTCLFTTDINKKGTMQLIGYTESAESLRQFMEKLSATKLINKIELSSLQPESSKTNQLYKFTLLAELQSE